MRVSGGPLTYCLILEYLVALKSTMTLQQSSLFDTVSLLMVASLCVCSV